MKQSTRASLLQLLIALSISAHSFQVRAQSPSPDTAALSTSFVDRKVGVINQLRWLSASLRELRLKLNPELSLHEDELTRILQESRLAQLTGQDLGVSTRGLRTLRRRAIDTMIGYPQLLITLGTSLFELSLRRDAPLTFLATV